MKIIAFAGLLAALLLPLGAQAAGKPGIAAAPMTYEGINPTWPRLTSFPDAKVKAAVNAILATKEKDARKEKAECYGMLREMKQKPDDDSYYTDLSVTYLSQRYMTVMVRTSSYCGGAYPNNGIPSPITIDLTNGRRLDWQSVFKTGFLSTETSPGAIIKFYRMRYPKDADQECKDRIQGRDPFESTTVLHLDAKRGLVIEPEFPHVIAVCAEEIALSAKDLAPYLRNKTLLEDLKATVKK